jgi:hypothetical protein
MASHIQNTVSRLDQFIIYEGRWQRVVRRNLSRRSQLRKNSNHFLR